MVKIVHWGFEYNLYPMPLDIELAHKMIDNGADLIIGHHPHVIQAKEVYKGKNIYYSLGNFYFSQTRQSFSKKKFNGKIHDRCSYGLGVVYDVEKENVEKEIIIYYDSNTGESTIETNVNNMDEILPDISDISYDNKKYYHVVKSNKLNGNPILTGKKVSDMIKIYILKVKYLLKKIIKNCLKLCGIQIKK